MRSEADASIYRNKIGFLQSINRIDNPLTADSNSVQIGTLLREEIRSARIGQKPLDILEICSGEKLGTVGSVLGSYREGYDVDSEVPGSDFSAMTESRAHNFLNQFEDVTEVGDPIVVADFLSTNRKNMGFCTSDRDLTRLGQILAEGHDEGLLEADSVTIAQYPGSFHPFPHVGHAEVAEQVEEVLMRRGRKDRRVMVSTITRSTEKSIGDNFSDRVDNLVRGFADHDRVSVLGIPSDLTQSEEVIEFRQLVARMDSQGRGRHVMGSDTLQSRIAKAREGDLLSDYLINTGNTIFLSIRGDADPLAVSHAIETVSNEFDSEIVVLPLPKLTVSGTIVRGLDLAAQRQYAASPYVKIN